jgi:hypothetical protein
MSNLIVPRRTVLKGLGVAFALPWLEALAPVLHAADGPVTGAVPRRIVAIQPNMGIMPQLFFPEKVGRDYVLSPYLEKLAKHRDQFTVFSGVSHPGVTGGHAAERCFLTGTPHPDRGGFRNWISLDQYAAEQLGNVTRYPSLVLAMTNEGGQTLSFTRSGAAISAERNQKKLFQKLFVQGGPDEVAAAVEALRQGRSTLDFVGEQAKRLNAMLPAADRQRLEQYATSVRDLEGRLHSAEEWEHRAKPVVKAEPPSDTDDAREFVKRSGLFLDVIKLALETDSTRLVTLFVDNTIIHNSTHHGNRPEVIAELRSHEEGHLKELARFLDGLAGVQEQGQTLLDRTMVLYGTCMGSANSHSNVNLPVLLAGGGFRHGQHLAFDQERNQPLANLYLSMLHRLGIPAKEFSTSTGPMPGLEFA